MELPRRTGLRKTRRKNPRRYPPPPEPAPAITQRWVALGVVMGTHGVRGELRVKLHNPSSDLLLQLDAVHLRTAPAESPRRYALAGVRPGSKGLLVQFARIDTVEQAQALRGAEVCVARGQLPDLPEGEFYHCDVEGLALVGIDGRPLGTVERVHDYPAASVLRVRTGRGLLEVPMREPYLVGIDLRAQQVVVDRLDDLDPERG